MIIVGNETGLAARIKNIVSALRRSHVYNDQVVIHNFDHHYIFYLEQIANRTLDYQDWYLTWKLEDPQVDTKLLYDETQKTVVLNQYGPPSIYHNVIDFQFDNITLETRQKWIQYFNLLKWNPYLLAEVDRLYIELDLKDAVGVHMRSWYEDKIKKAVCGLYDIDMFVRSIESLSPKKIFLCADHVSVVDDLHKALDPSIQIITRENYLPAQRHIEFDNNIDILVYAGIDLLLLSRCQTIVGSYQSTFTEVAWWIGQCLPKMIVPVPDCVIQEAQQFELEKQN